VCGEEDGKWDKMRMEIPSSERMGSCPLPSSLL